MKSTINLFKALPIEKKTKKKATKALLEKTIKLGFVFSPEVLSNYSNHDELIKMVKEVIGISAKEINSSFHKSWKKVKEASMEQLIMEQLVHYFTTYGFENMGIYSEESVYIPAEKLEIPELKEGIRLVVIKGYTKKELKKKLLALLQLGVALKEDTKDDVLDVATFVEINEKEIVTVKNKEVKIALYEYLNIIPQNPLEFLRYVIFKATDDTLLIKNNVLISKIKECKSLSIVKLFTDYEKKVGLNRLAEIFYRYKPLFLAFRTSTKMKKIINKTRRLAVNNHKPMPEDFLNSVTAKINSGVKITKEELIVELEKVNTFRKIRLAYALKFRTKDVDSIMYKIRNGKGYSTDFSFNNKGEAKKILNIIIDSITEDVKKNVNGKKIYIPDYINYSLPATEKQFSGNLPSGTYIDVPENMIIGVHWYNVKANRVDLDLSSISTVDGKIGWDSSYRSDGGNTLFSGDVTDACGENGASELIYVKKQLKQDVIVMLNYYNYNSDVPCPFKIIVASEKPNNFGNNYMVDPNNIIAAVPTVIDKKQKVIGLLITTTKGSRFYFSETNIGNSITSSGEGHVSQSRKYLLDFYQNSIELKDILESAGAIITNDVEDDNIDINLYIEVLEKDTILNLLK